MENPTNYNDAINDDSSYLFSVGFDLPGELKDESKVSFGHLKSALTSSSRGDLKEMRSSFDIKDLFGSPITNSHGNKVSPSLHNLNPFWIPQFKDVNERIREYYLENSVGKQGFDELLIHLFMRKNNLLTSEAREGFIHIKLLDICNMGLYHLKGGKENVDAKQSVPNNILGSSERSQHIMVKFDKKDPCKILGGILVEANPTAEKCLDARLQLYLQIKLESGYDKFGRICKDEFLGKHPNVKNLDKEITTKELLDRYVNRVATVTAIVDPLSGEKHIPEFIANAHEIYVDIGNCNILLEKEEYDELNLLLEPLMVELPKEHPKLVLLYDFVVALIWLTVVKRVRENVGKKGWPQPRHPGTCKGCYEKRYKSKEKFIEDLHDHKGRILFQVKAVQMNQMPVGDTTRNLNDMHEGNPEWIRFASNIVYGGVGSTISSQDLYFRHKLQHGKLGTSDDYAILVGNNAISFSRMEDYPVKKYDAGYLDAEEMGPRWVIGWYALLSGMLCSLAETFLLYNAEIVRHAHGKEDISELRTITKQAIDDFLPYYDVGVISSEFYGKVFEEAKETFSINRYHQVLVEKLNLFSNYEIAQANLDLSHYALSFTIFAVVFGFLGFLFTSGIAQKSLGVPLVGIGVLITCVSVCYIFRMRLELLLFKFYGV